MSPCLRKYHARMLQHLSGMTFFEPSTIPDRLSYVSGFSVLRPDGLRGLLGLLRREIAARDVSRPRARRLCDGKAYGAGRPRAQ